MAATGCGGRRQLLAYVSGAGELVGLSYPTELGPSPEPAEMTPGRFTEDTVVDDMVLEVMLTEC